MHIYFNDSGNMLKLGKSVTSLLALCVLFCCATTLRASTFIIPPDDDLIIGARLIIRGKVLSTSCQADDQRHIFTYIRIRVRQVLKGQIDEPEIVIKEEGGQVGTRGSLTFGAPQFKAGEKVLLYLDARRDGSLRVYQMFLGKFSIAPDTATGRRFVVRDNGGNNISVIQSGINGESGPATSRMELSAYLDMVRTRAEATRERSQAFANTYYKDFSLIATPAEYVSVGDGEFAPDYVFGSSPPARWFEPDTGDTVSYAVNPDGAPTSRIVDDVTAALNAWSSVAGCALRLVNNGASDVCSVRPNSIVFNNCDNWFSPTPNCGTILALGAMNWDSSQSRVINGTTFVKIFSGHVSFNPYASCFFSDRCRVQEIATHEVGHTLGLAHSQFSDATMSSTAHFDGRCASIRQDDINAVLFMYPAAGGGGGTLTIQTTSPLAAGATGSPFSRQLAASGGTTPYAWSLVSGSLPAGLGLSPAGLVSGTPAAPGTSTFTVRVTDAANATADKQLSITVADPASGYDSQFISQVTPATVGPGQSFFASVRWLNTGTRLWDGAAGFVMVSRNPANNATWGGNQVPWFNSAVEPGQQMEFAFQATAPGTPGTYDFQWQLYQQGVGFFGQTSTNVAITVGGGGTPAALSITSANSLNAVVGVFLTYIPTASGGTPPYNWTVPAGTLPAGLSLSSGTGTFFGTPTAAGIVTVTLQVTDSTRAAAQKPLMISVAAAPLDVATSALPSAIRGAAYNQPLTATGGRTPYAWTITGGGLPAGLSLSAAGVISGTPSAAGNFNFSATATDADSRAATKPLSIAVINAPLSIAKVPTLDAAQGSLFSYQLSATGGTPPYSWSVTSGTMPAGLTMTSGGGVISGTPTVPGSSTLTVTVRDQSAVITTATIQIRVLDPAAIPAIRKVKYKNVNKLVVTGDRINAAAVLLIDGNLTQSIPNEDQFVLKPLALPSGRHEIRIVNPGAISSQPFLLDVQ